MYKRVVDNVLVITRCRLQEQDCRRLAAFGSLKLTLLFTYSGIHDSRIEPFPSG